jgi:hypothetical protein
MDTASNFLSAKSFSVMAALIAGRDFGNAWMGQ